MDALKLTATDHPGAARGPDGPALLVTDEVSLGQRIKAAIPCRLAGHEPPGGDHVDEPGLEALRRAQFSPDSSASPGVRTPRWDRHRHELRLGAIVVRRFTIPAADQESVLAAFEEERWPARIEDPLPPCSEIERKARLQEVVQRLNRSRRLPVVRFACDAAGRGIVWEFCGDQTQTHEP